jgi:hypothetical protein
MRHRTSWLTCQFPVAIIGIRIAIDWLVLPVAPLCGHHSAKGKRDRLPVRLPRRHHLRLPQTAWEALREFQLSGNLLFDALIKLLYETVRLLDYRGSQGLEPRFLRMPCANCCCDPTLRHVSSSVMITMKVQA